MSAKKFKAIRQQLRSHGVDPVAPSLFVGLGLILKALCLGKISRDPGVSIIDSRFDLADDPATDDEINRGQDQQQPKPL